MISDSELIKEITAGSHAAMEVLVARHYKSIYTYVYRLTGNYHLSCDVTQEVFIRMIKGLGAYRENGKFINWLFKIAVNCCRDHCRSNAKQTSQLQTLSIDLPDDRDNVYDIFCRKTERERIKAALDSLPSLQREVIVLKFYHDLKIKEIAELTQASQSTVKSRLREGIAKLKIMLFNDGGDIYEFREDRV